MSVTKSITIKTISDMKGYDIFTIKPDDSVYNAIRRFSEENIGALLVMVEDKLDGIITERDYARKVILVGKSSKKTLVKEILTRKVIYVELDNTIEEAMAIMTEKHIRHLPVLKDGKCVGLVSISDLIKKIISEQDFTIEQMTKYISGGYIS